MTISSGEEEGFWIPEFEDLLFERIDGDNESSFDIETGLSSFFQSSGVSDWEKRKESFEGGKKLLGCGEKTILRWLNTSD